MKSLKVVAVAVFVAAGIYLIIGCAPPSSERQPAADVVISAHEADNTRFSTEENLSGRPYELIFNETFDGVVPTSSQQQLVAHRYIRQTAHPLDRASNSSNFNQALQVTYQGSERGSERVVRRLPVGAQGDDMILSFDVTFCEDFDFARGGKLHGLGPRNPVTGGNEMTQEGWSVRLMWRQQGRLQTYIYHHDKPGRFGDTKYAEDFNFEPGRNHHIQLRTRLNTLDQPNGLVQVWVDGNLLIEHDELMLRQAGSADSLIQQLLFSTFHGGSSPEWAPRDEKGEFKQDCAYFDNFQVRKFTDTNV